MDGHFAEDQALCYDKGLTVAVEIAGEEKITMMELLRGIKEVCGVVSGCRFKADRKYEVTMMTACGKIRLLDGFKIRDASIMAKDLSLKEMSFIPQPASIYHGSGNIGQT